MTTSIGPIAKKHTNGYKNKSAPSSEHILNAFLC